MRSRRPRFRALSQVDGVLVFANEVARLQVGGGAPCGVCVRVRRSLLCVCGESERVSCGAQRVTEAEAGAAARGDIFT